MAFWSVLALLPDADARRVMVSGARDSSREAWCATAGSGLVKVALDQRFGAAGVVGSGPVADRHFRVNGEVRLLHRAGHRGDPAEQVGAVPLPDRMQNAGAGPTVFVDRGSGGPHDRVSHLDERRRDLLNRSHKGPAYAHAQIAIQTSTATRRWWRPKLMPRQRRNVFGFEALLRLLLAEFLGLAVLDLAFFGGGLDIALVLVVEPLGHGRSRNRATAAGQGACLALNAAGDP